jgi:hypothetical protein
MVRVRDVVSLLLSLAWRGSFAVVAVGLLAAIYSGGKDDSTNGLEVPAKGLAVFSDNGTNALVTLGEAGTRNFSTCIIQDQGANELARVNFYKSGHVCFEFGSTSAVRGSGVLSNNELVGLGVASDLKHKYDLSVHPDGSSVVQAMVRDDSRVRTIRLSPRGDVLGN